MLRNLVRAFVTFVGVSAGYGLGLLFENVKLYETFLNISKADSVTTLVLNIVLAIIFGIIFYLSSPWFVRRVVKFADSTEKELQKIPFNMIFGGAIGLIVGLVIAYLLIPLLKNLVGENVINTMLSVGLYVILGFIGSRLGTRNLSDPSKLSEMVGAKATTGGQRHTTAMPKVLDTSVIIDGRIADVCKTGFIEGQLIIAEFVLEELRHIADSSDSLKRNRGRRGLDMLNQLRTENDMDVVVVSDDFDDVNEVDVKLLKLAQKYNGAVVTNDFNLNKVAAVQGVKVLNLNELANAIKPVVLPGEEMIVQVVKEGKENRQGIAYLDDGTMIVVEEGRKIIGETITVIVTSVLQTAAGRMIFAKPKE